MLELVKVDLLDDIAHSLAHIIQLLLVILKLVIQQLQVAFKHFLQLVLCLVFLRNYFHNKAAKLIFLIFKILRLLNGLVKFKPLVDCVLGFTLPLL